MVIVPAVSTLFPFPTQYVVIALNAALSQEWAVGLQCAKHHITLPYLLNQSFDCKVVLDLG